mgnify:CR=1 FL=1|jgi:periplasmic mercuric ion binding protein
MTIKALLLFGLLFGLVSVPAVYAEPSSPMKSSRRTVLLNVQNMTCSMCKFTIKKALSSVAGTEKVRVNFEDKTATVTFNPQKTNNHALIEAITNAGYPATVQSTKQ